MSSLMVNIISIDIKNLDVSMYELGLTDRLDLCYVGPFLLLLLLTCDKTTFF